MGINSFIDSRNHGLNFVRVCQRHGEWLAIHRLADRFVIYISASGVDVAHDSVFLRIVLGAVGHTVLILYTGNKQT